MKRWVLVFALLLSPLLLQPAAAHARTINPEPALPAMCVDAAQTLLLSTRQPLPLGASELQNAASNNSDDGQTAWCISPDDPRCSPRDAGAPLQTQRSLPQLCDFASLRTPEPIATETDPMTLRARLGAPRAGVSMRLERPPRV